MKNCPGCQREIDKHRMACQYCGYLVSQQEEHHRRDAEEASRKNEKGGKGKKR